MQNKKLTLCLLLSVLFSCNKKLVPSVEPMIIPQPSKLEFANGDFILSDETQLIASEGFKIASEYLKAFILEGSGISLKESTGVNTISFVKEENFTNPEAYTLEVSEDKITISALSDKGAFYAVQSLRQLLPVGFENNTFANKKLAVKCLKIEDAPQFPYRGMHLDVGRHMFSVDFIKKYIDALAMLKLNTFHWHLTEDQGWRIEIKKYPKLQEIAAFRSETLIGHYDSQPQLFDGKRYGGYYTQEEIKEVVAYATERFVTVIPEIELPGHSQAAIAAYPELGCTGEQVEVAKKGGVYENIYCSKEETFTFLENVFDEVLALFPSEYIHIGGDEAPKTHWKNCAACQQRIQDEGLKDEHELQSYFISRIEKYLNSKGRQIIGWDEILEGGLAPNATVMSWRGFNGAIQAAKQQHQVILTPGSHCYFDHYQSEDKAEPLAIGGYLPLEKVYGLNPIPEELSPEEAKYVLGAQGNVWTEYMQSSKKVEYMVFPRILALSEVVWSSPTQKNYKEFAARVENFHKRLDALEINYANHFYEIEGSMITSEDQVAFQLETASQGKTIRYTKDGSEPNLQAEIYTKPIPITESTTIKASVFNDVEALGKTFTQEILVHKAVGKKITINKKPNPAYLGSGASGLINGIAGSDTRFNDKQWLGFWGEDIEITIDLGKETAIQSVETRFHNGNVNWIYAPKEVTVVFDTAEEKQQLKSPISEELIVPMKVEKSTKTRFIKLLIPNFEIIPHGKAGAGNKAWIFIDEIIVK
ncbi:family 20 glycosylhydrolase [Oceanihabitans sediminis]|uniref:beta-N-acetylhexosaminidase n=1 Tax=Oceanihabitans sediminis TaxID=1812012 RepID=UPI00299D6F88|nr:family 20 glycosylhydrolase [Oceanihabitans sediminis]MDX1772723.1 family 20 glycosylhydrolase [Oceanihabitans sediminis]